MVRIAAATASLLVAGTALAVPATVTESDTDEDATVTLTILNQTITDGDTNGYDVRSFCRIRIVDTGGGDDFSNGDRIELEVRESDAPAGSDLIWSTAFNVSSAEVSANRVDRTFDCSSDFSYDGFGDNLEVYGWAKVEKDDTCGLCRYDRPETDNIDVSVRADDAREDNDAVGAGTVVNAGRTNDFVANDVDYLRFVNPGVNRIQLDLYHDPGAGVVTAEAVMADGTPIVANVTQARNPSLTTALNDRANRTAL